MAQIRQNSVRVVLLTAVVLLPVFAPRFFTQVLAPTGPWRIAGILLSLAAPLGALVLCWRTFPEGTAPRTKAFLLLTLCVLSTLLTSMHYRFIDSGQYFADRTNTEWQQQINDAAVWRDARFLPHSYRFLPDSFAQLVQSLSGSFSYARTLYRLTVGLLLLFAIHRFAALYCGPVASMNAVLLYCLVYPMTIMGYAGQLTDPASHLSFVVAFLALATGVFPYFVLALVIGTLAKETVIALLGYYLLFHRHEKAFWVKFTGATAVSLAVALIARLGVVGPRFGYAEVSGVGLDHVKENLLTYYLWGPAVLLTVGVFLPPVALAWREAPATLKRLTVFLAPVLFVSSTAFSWLHETRNYVPLIVPMAIITARHLEVLARRQAPAEASSLTAGGAG